MAIGAITGYIDVAQLALYVFWLFFAGLIYYLHQEDKREGYPLVSDRSPYITVQGFPEVPSPKSFLTQHGPIYAPRAEPPQVVNGVAAGRGIPGSPFNPTGNPMLAGMGPGAYAQNRADIPDYTFDDNLPKIVPLRSVPEFFLAWEDPNVIGMPVFGLDRVQAGVVTDAWVDRSEVVIRYVEVSLLAPATKSVLMPMNFLSINGRARRISTSFITAAQFADVPVTKSPDVITFLEEEKIMAYYGGGCFYALPSRTEPLV